jgi:dCTP deaminase
MNFIQPTRGVGINPIPYPKYPIQFPMGVEYPDKNGDMQVNWLYGPGDLPDWAIRHFISIDPFVDYGEHNKDVAVSYGLTSAGYDLRVGYKFKVFTNAYCGRVSPKHLTPDCFVEHDLGHCWMYGVNGYCGATCISCLKQIPYQVGDKVPEEVSNNERCLTKPDHIQIPPNCFALAESIERVWIPRNVNCICTGKSTYARCGINLNFTPFEPGWWGIVTVEIINATPLPCEILAGQGIAQAQFKWLAGHPEMSYDEKPHKKYQGQAGLTLPNQKA